MEVEGPATPTLATPPRMFIEAEREEGNRNKFVSIPWEGGNKTHGNPSDGSLRLLLIRQDEMIS